MTNAVSLLLPENVPYYDDEDLSDRRVQRGTLTELIEVPG